MIVTISTPIYPTEESSKVIQAILNIFPGCDIDETSTEITGTATSIDQFKTLLGQQRIRSAARGKLLGGRNGNRLCFSLNKQAAYAGSINFSLKSPSLGCISVEIESDDVNSLIDELAPPDLVSKPQKGKSPQKPSEASWEEDPDIGNDI